MKIEWSSEIDCTRCENQKQAFGTTTNTLQPSSVAGIHNKESVCLRQNGERANALIDSLQFSEICWLNSQLTFSERYLMRNISMITTTAAEAGEVLVTADKWVKIPLAFA